MGDYLGPASISRAQSRRDNVLAERRTNEEVAAAIDRIQNSASRRLERGQSPFDEDAYPVRASRMALGPVGISDREILLRHGLDLTVTKDATGKPQVEVFLSRNAERESAAAFLRVEDFHPADIGGICTVSVRLDRPIREILESFEDLIRRLQNGHLELGPSPQDLSDARARTLKRKTLLRDLRMWEDRRTGIPVADVATKYNVKSRTVYARMAHLEQEFGFPRPRSARAYAMGDLSKKCRDECRKRTSLCPGCPVHAALRDFRACEDDHDESRSDCSDLSP